MTERPEPAGPSRCTLLVQPAQAAPPAQTSVPAYVVVIDAGSGGTRLALFAPGPGLAVEKAFGAPTKTAGLSTFADDPALAGPTAIGPLLAELSGYLQGQGIAKAEVPISLQATAGLRRLQLSNPSAVQGILASTGSTIADAGYPVLANEILPDYDEALFAWLDANASAGTLADPAKDLGIIEVGGASAQVAYRLPPAPRGARPIFGQHTVVVDGRPISVFAVSYLGLGNNEARDAMQGASSGGRFCFPNNLKTAAPTFYLAESAWPVRSATASFKTEACGQAYSRAITATVRQLPRRERPEELSRVPGFGRASFIGLGAIPLVLSNLGVGQGADERRMLDKALRVTCAGRNAWAKVRALSPETPSAFLETTCASGAYLWQLLFGPHGVGVKASRFEGRPSLPGGAPSWSSGYAISVLHA